MSETATKCMDHTYGPSGYVAWHEWAERMTVTHDQERCAGCGLWMIWTPRDSGRAETPGDPDDSGRERA